MPPNYQQGKIYTIRNKIDDKLIYVGSTTKTLSGRLANHKGSYKKGDSVSLYSYINDIEDFKNNWFIELYELYPCNSKEELNKREGEVIREIGTINKVIAGRTLKEYKLENADIIKEQRKKYRLENAEIIKEKQKKYNLENAEIIKEKNKNYKLENAEIIKEQRKKYRLENAEIIKEKRKKYYLENKTKNIL